MLKIASLRDLLPTLLLSATQALWFLVPLLAIRFNLFQDSVSLSLDTAVYAFFWVALGHAVQYLWITAFYAQKDGRTSLASAFLGKSLFAGAMIWVIPAILFAPGALGRLPYDAGFALLVAAAVNVHHFILDGAIWKLKHGPIARILLRDAPADTAGEPGGSGVRAFAMTPAVRKLAFVGIGLLCVGLHYYSTVSTMTLERAWERSDAALMDRSLHRLDWMGRDSGKYDSRLGVLLARQGDMQAAVRKGEQAVRLDPGVETWGNLSLIRERAGNLGGAILAMREAIWLAPESGKLGDRLEYLFERGMAQGGEARRTVLAVANDIRRTFGRDNERLAVIAAGVLDLGYSGSEYEVIQDNDQAHPTKAHRGFWSGGAPG
jgi:tetratricopeptide (TPR) repeat protein